MIRLALRVHRDQAEIALAELLELAPSGIEEVDLGEAVEYAIYGPPGELPALPDLRAAAGGALVDISTSEVADDWEQRWRAFHTPVEIGPPSRRLHVRPPWSPPRYEPGLQDVVIDPGQAFGTGAHATTRLCLELLLELEPGGGFVDVGCGSGVLAIAAAKLGWGGHAGVLGVDHEAESLVATADNARANGVRVRTLQHDLLRDGPVPGADTVAANLLRPLLLCVAEEGFRDRRPQTLVAGGLLAHEVDEVARQLSARLGLLEVERRHAGDWAALLVRAG